VLDSRDARVPPGSLWTAAMDEARRAPSLHNGQHFHLLVDGRDDRSATVMFELERGIPVGDSTGRFLFVALGAFLESLGIALGTLGYATVDELLCDDPHAPYRATNADVPIARIRIGEVLDDDLRAGSAALGELARRRQTNRKRFTGAAVASALLEEVAARQRVVHGVALSFNDDPATVRWVIRQNARVLFDDLDDDALRRELAGFIRFSRASSRRTRDGLAAETFGFPGALLRLFFALHGAATSRPLEPLLLRLYEHSSGGVPAVIWARSPFATAHECVACGRSLLHLWLELTRLGIAFQPFGSLITNVRMRDELLDRIGEPGSNEDGEVWLAGRVGYATRGPESIRRRTADLVRIDGGDT
jgi:hypothetical protein